MYFFGIDVPLVELIFGLGVIGIVILLEIIVVLVLLTFHLRNSKKLENQMAKLSHGLMKLEGKGLREISKLKKLSSKEEKFVSRLRLGKNPLLSKLKQSRKNESKDFEKKSKKLFKKIDSVTRRRSK